MRLLQLRLLRFPALNLVLLLLELRLCSPLHLLRLHLLRLHLLLQHLLLQHLAPWLLYFARPRLRPARSGQGSESGDQYERCTHDGCTDLARKTDGISA